MEGLVHHVTGLDGITWAVGAPSHAHLGRARLELAQWELAISANLLS